MKARWTEAEDHLLALQEATILAENPEVRNINQHLFSIFPHRTLEAIKGQRRRVAHRETVQRLLEE